MIRAKAQFFRDREFEDPNWNEAVKHVQRCRDVEWRTALLNNQDSFRVGNEKRKLIGTSLGWGVVEIKLSETKTAWH